MSTSLVKTSDVNFKSKWLYVKPATVTINQPMTQAEGAIKGQLRIVETGEQFTSLQVALLIEPQEHRNYSEGKFPNIVNLCFSRDMIRPSELSKHMQAQLCSGCQHSDWSRWREQKDLTGQSDPNLIPKCQPQYYIVMVDTQTKLPLQMYIKGVASRKAFEAGMSNVAREMLKIRSKGLQPQYYDVQFTLSSEKEKASANYILKITGVKPITDNEREAFGEVYLNYVSTRQASSQEEVEAAAQAQQDKSIDAELTNNQSNDTIDGEYIEI